MTIAMRVQLNILIYGINLNTLLLGLIVARGKHNDYSLYSL